MDYSLPGSSVHGILQARILEWVPRPSSRGSSQPRDQTQVSCGSCIGRPILYHWCYQGSLVAASRGYAMFAVCGFFSCGAQVLGFTGFKYLGHTSLVALRHVASTWTKDRTSEPCIGKWILYPGTTRDTTLAQVYFNKVACCQKTSLLQKKKKKTTELWIQWHRGEGYPGDSP